MKKFGFIYIWLDKKHHKYYIGRHWGLENDGYICSSRMMRQSYNRRPNDFKRRIISRVYTSNQDLILEEQRWLDMIKSTELGIRYYNKNVRSNSPSMLGIKHTDETKRKISESMRGRFPSEYNKIKRLESCLGRKQSNEEKQKRAKKLRGLKRSAETCEKIRIGHLGKPKPSLSVERKLQISLANRGRTHNDESKSRISAAASGKVMVTDMNGINKKITIETYVSQQIGDVCEWQYVGMTSKEAKRRRAKE